MYQGVGLMTLKEYISSTLSGIGKLLFSLVLTIYMPTSSVKESAVSISFPKPGIVILFNLDMRCIIS